MIEMKVAGVTLDEQKHPVVILKNGDRILPIWIGHAEAFSISQALQNGEFERPLTHDLICYILRGFSSTVKHVEVYKLEKGTYYACLTVTETDAVGNERRIIKIDCRPSDAIAVAVRLSCPVYVADKVLDEGGHDASSYTGDDSD
ncbi:MAG: bifunctional nuclease family protein [Candidatus Hydrogenedentes bacterium]|nr:bifunctional nuclease family protein [Candidatus Hydrogenedentota bacterium]